jgi:hypothetical protein
MKSTISPLCIISVAALTMIAFPAAFAATSSTDSANEPDKSMKAAHESFVKGDMQKASAYIGKAAASVDTDSERVATSAPSKQWVRVSTPAASR